MICNQRVSNTIFSLNYSFMLLTFYENSFELTDFQWTVTLLRGLILPICTWRICVPVYTYLIHLSNGFSIYYYIFSLFWQKFTQYGMTQKNYQFFIWKEKMMRIWNSIIFEFRELIPPREWNISYSALYWWTWWLWNEYQIWIKCVINNSTNDTKKRRSKPESGNRTKWSKRKKAKLNIYTFRFGAASKWSEPKMIFFFFRLCCLFSL